MRFSLLGSASTLLTLRGPFCARLADRMNGPAHIAGMLLGVGTVGLAVESCKSPADAPRSERASEAYATAGDTGALARGTLLCHHGFLGGYGTGIGSLAIGHSALR